MLKVKIYGQELVLEQILYLDARFIAAEHPETGKPVLFIRVGEPIPFVALNRLGMRLASASKEYKGITYYELEENKDESEKVSNLRGRS